MDALLKQVWRLTTTIQLYDKSNIVVVLSALLIAAPRTITISTANQILILLLFSLSKTYATRYLIIIQNLRIAVIYSITAVNVIETVSPRSPHSKRD